MRNAGIASKLDVHCNVLKCKFLSYETATAVQFLLHYDRWVIYS